MNSKHQCHGCEAEHSPDTLHTKPSQLHTIAVVDTEIKCIEAVKQIMSDCSESKHRAVGLDAEWNHVYGMRAFGSKIGRIAIVSICSPRGYCALFRMHKFGKIPSSLQDLMKDASVAKVGVGIEMLATHLWTDFELKAQRYADLRVIAMGQTIAQGKTIAQPLARKIHDIFVNRDLSRFDHTKWLAEELLPEYIQFATKDVYASIEIHKKIVPTWIVESFEDVSD